MCGVRTVFKGKVIVLHLLLRRKKLGTDDALQKCLTQLRETSVEDASEYFKDHASKELSSINGMIVSHTQLAKCDMIMTIIDHCAGGKTAIMHPNGSDYFNA